MNEMPLGVPKVSVCIPTYNRAGYLQQCVTSVIRQTRSDFELVISDNASTDGTREMVTALRDPRLRYIRHVTNVGSRENWNRCMAVARGEYVAICHDDDYYEPTFLEQTCALLDRHPSAGFVYTAAYTTDTAGKRIGLSRVHRSDQFWKHPALGLQFLEHNHDVVFSSVVARRGAYGQVGRFDPGLLCGDYEMWLKLSFLFDVGYLSTPLVSYRSHRLSTTASMLPARFVEENRVIVNRVIDWVMPQMPSLSSRRSSALAAVDRVWAKRSLQTAWASLADGAFEQASAYLQLLVQLDQRGWPTQWQATCTRACLNPMGRRIAQGIQEMRRVCRRVLLTGMPDGRICRLP